MTFKKIIIAVIILVLLYLLFNFLKLVFCLNTMCSSPYRNRLTNKCVLRSKPCPALLDPYSFFIYKEDDSCPSEFSCWAND